jgi:hypothetical protein
MSAKESYRIIANRLADALRPLGFVEKGKGTLMRYRDDIVQVINLQKGKQTTKDKVVVTVNLGAYSIPLGQELGSPAPDDIWDCHWRERLGFLLADKTDKWWDIHNLAEADSFAADLSEMISKSALPLFERLDSTSNLVCLWQQGASPGLTKVERDRYLELLSRN